MKRRYTSVSIQPRGDAYGIALDGMPLKTPVGAELIVPTLALAEAIAEEWQAQAAQSDRLHLPMTRLVATCIDRVAPRPHAMVAELLRFGESDLLCYRAEGPPDLVLRQEIAWRPLLDWLAEASGVELVVTAGIMPKPQAPDAIARLRQFLQRHDAEALTALAVATPAAGSLVIALALVAGRLTPDQAFAVSQLDETFQIEHWGQDEEAAVRRAGLAADLASVVQFLAALGRPVATT
jgi:chaperone required for assembly of F1-ATPase